MNAELSEYEEAMGHLADLKRDLVNCILCSDMSCTSCYQKLFKVRRIERKYVYGTERT